MQINSLSSAQAAQSLAGAARQPAGRTQAASASVAMPADQLDLSPEAQALSQTQATGQASSVDDIRWERVNALRQAIAEGNYDTSERISGAVDNFLDAYA